MRAFSSPLGAAQPERRGPGRRQPGAGGAENHKAPPRPQPHSARWRRRSAAACGGAGGRFASRKCPSAAGCPCPARIHLLPEEPPGRVPDPGVGPGFHRPATALAAGPGTLALCRTSTRCRCRVSFSFVAHGRGAAGCPCGEQRGWRSCCCTTSSSLPGERRPGPSTHGHLYRCSPAVLRAAGAGPHGVVGAGGCELTSPLRRDLSPACRPR